MTIARRFGGLSLTFINSRSTPQGATAYGFYAERKRSFQCASASLSLLIIASLMRPELVPYDE